jgi:hypothetical protein
MSLIKETEFWLRGIQDHGELPDDFILHRIIAALKAGQGMRDATYVGENGQIYSKKGFSESCVAWDAATGEDV